MEILCIGLSSYDITYPLDSYIKENTKVRTKNRVECGGGQANNIAYLLGKWEENVYYAGIVGNDKHGKIIKEELEKVNVNTDYMQTRQDVITTVSNIIANIKDGTRTILTYSPSDVKLEELDLNFTPDIILVDGYEYEASIQVLDKYKDKITIIDAGRLDDNIVNLAKKVKYLICSKNFAEEYSKEKFDFSDSNSIIYIFNKLKQDFRNNIIITLEGKGALYEKGGRIKLMPSLKVNAVDTTGAGDYFHAAFIYGISNNYSYEDSIKLACITGALSVTKVGSKSSAPSLKQVLKVFDEYK